MRKSRLVCLASGGGRTIENLHKKIQEGALEAEIALVIASTETAGIVEKCKHLNLDCLIIDKNRYSSTKTYHKVLLSSIFEARHDWIILAGWLQLFPMTPEIEGRAINIHPSLLPAYGGKGFYGNRVHEAVANDKCHTSGCTVHFVTKHYDQGPIIIQEAINIPKDSTSSDIAELVFEAEKRVLPEAINALINERAYWEQGQVYWTSE